MTRQDKLLDRELDIAMTNRLFEIQHFWQRSNYFLGLMVAMGAAAYSVKNTDLVTVVFLAGSVSSFFWFRTNLGSKFWQESWEKEVAEISKEIGVRSFMKSNKEIYDHVKESLESGSNLNRLRKCINELVLRKPSVTYNMIMLSLFSTCIWVLFLIVSILNFLFDDSKIAFFWMLAHL